MNPATRTLLNDPELLAARAAWMGRLTRLFAGQPADTVFALNGVTGNAAAEQHRDPERWVAEVLDDLAARAEALRDRAVFRPLIVGPWPYGVHFIDRIFGADVYELDSPGNWQARVLNTPVGSLRPPDLDRDPTWAVARRLLEAFLEADVAVPIYSMPVLSSPLNIGLNLYGQDLLAAMLLSPAAARHDLRVITDVIGALHRWHRDRVPPAQLQATVACGRAQPPGYGQLCGCSCHVLSGDQYREFIAPLDDELLSLYPGGGLIHLCGQHTQHIPVWRAMKSLRSIQINDRAAEDLPIYFEGLRKDQILYVNPCPGMMVDQIMEITGGRRLVMAMDIPPTPVRPVA
jgi:hypothetical protein